MLLLFLKAARYDEPSTPPRRPFPAAPRIARAAAAQSWHIVRLQARFREKLAALNMELRVAGALPRAVTMDPVRARQVRPSPLRACVRFVGLVGW